ncbi:MAG: hypothetical protein AAFP83_21865 [Bacteroidota bacterium]
MMRNLADYISYFPISVYWTLLGGLLLILAYYGAVFLSIYRKRNAYTSSEVLDPYDLSPPLMHIIYYGKSSFETLLINFYYAVSKGSHRIIYKQRGLGFIVEFQNPDAWRRLDPATRAGLGFNGIPLPKISVRKTISKMTNSLYEELVGRLERQVSAYIFNKRRVIIIGMGITLLYSLVIWATNSLYAFGELEIKGAVYLVILSALIAAMFFIVIFASNRFGNLGKAAVMVIGFLTFCTFGLGFGGILVLINILLLYANLLGLLILPRYSSKGRRLKQKLEELREELRSADENDPQKLPYMLALGVNCRTLIRIRGLYQEHHTQGDADRGFGPLDFHPY